MASLSSRKLVVMTPPTVEEGAAVGSFVAPPKVNTHCKNQNCLHRNGRGLDHMQCC